MTTFATAIKYASVAPRDIPLKPGDKRPPMRAWQDVATVGRATIEQWWQREYVDHGIGLALGQLEDMATTPTYVFAVDIDMHGIDGEAMFADLAAKHAELPQTCEAITGGGGRHLLFTAPHEVRNGALCDGVDIRGAGGQIVVEPTVHPSGQQYQWLDGQAPWEHDIAPAPAWILAALEPEPVAPERPRTPVAATGRPGDEWAASVTWADMLTRDGWTLDHTDASGESHWVRPGKGAREGTSATTNYAGSDSLKVFTSSMVHMGLSADTAYSKLGYLAATRFSGDHSAAASWCRGQGYGETVELADLREAIAPAEPTDEWPELQPLQVEHDLPPWPVHILPDWMADHICDTADQLQVPVDLCAQFALGAVASIAMGYTEVVVGGRWREPLNLYLATALPSGAGKSPAEKAMTAPVRAWEKDQREASMAAVSESDVHRKILEKRAKDAESSASTGSRDLAEGIAQAIEARRLLDEHEIKRPFRRLVDDATPEKLTQILDEQKGLVAVLSTEAELLDMVSGSYGGKGSKGPNINVYLKAYSGDTIMVDRKGGGGSGPTELRIDKPLLTVGLAMQPTVIDFISSQNGQLEGRGFLARFLISRPAPTTGRRDRSRVLDAPDTSAADNYHHHMIGFAHRWMWPVAEMALTPEAERRFVRSLQDQEAELQDRYLPISSWIAKLQSATLRVAGLLHLCDGRPSTDPLDVEVIERAIEAGEYWIAHALAMAVHPDDGQALSDAHAILQTATRKAFDTVTPRDLRLAMRSRFNRTEEMVPGLKHLEACGYLRLVAGQWSDMGVGGVSKLIQFRTLTVVEPPKPTTESASTRGSRGMAKRVGFEDSSIYPFYPPANSPPSAIPREPRVLDPEPQPVDNPEVVDNSSPAEELPTDPRTITWI